MQAETQLGARLLQRERLVVGRDAARRIGDDVEALHVGRVAVDWSPGSEAEVDLGEQVVRRADDAGIVHDLGDAEHAVLPRQRSQVGGSEAGASGLHAGGGHTGREHDPHVERQARRGVQHEADAVETADVGDLVRVADHGEGAVGHDGAGEVAGQHHRALDVHVPVDEAGADDGAVERVLRVPVVAARRRHPGDHAVLDGDVGRVDLAAEDVDDPASGQHEAGGLVAVGHADARGQAGAALRRGIVGRRGGGGRMHLRLLSAGGPAQLRSS